MVTLGFEARIATEGFYTTGPYVRLSPHRRDSRATGFSPCALRLKAVVSAECENMDKVMTKVKDLTPQSKQVNVLAKVVGLSEEKEITSRFGEARKLVEATVGDETATVLLTLWNEQIGQVAKDETLLIDNGYVSLVRGHIRLNVGKYGSIRSPSRRSTP